jgi:hypothetical protein
MDALQRTPITVETRQRLFQVLEQHPVTEQINFNLFAMLRLVTMLSIGLAASADVGGNLSRSLVDWGASRYVLATLAAIVAGLIGLFAGFLPFYFFDRLRTKRCIRKIKEASDEELWRIVDGGVWYFKSTLALAQLAARARDVGRVLPRLIQLLDSPEYTSRKQAHGALCLVFFDEARAVADYSPEAPYGHCRFIVARLKKMLAQTSAEPPNVASRSATGAASRPTRADAE